MTFRNDIQRVRWLAWAIQGLMFAGVLLGQTVTRDDYYLDNPQLEEYVTTALRENPGLEAALSNYRASLQKIPQVQALPDPMLTFTQFIRSPETRVGPQSNSTMVSQKFPWFGKLDLQGQIAAKQAAVQYEMYLSIEQEIVVNVKRAFYELAFLDRALQILEEEIKLLDHFEQMAQARYSQGGGMQQSVIKIQAEVTQLIDRQKMLRAQRDAFSARLNTLMNRPPEQPIPRVGNLELPAVQLDLQELYALAEEHRRELRASLHRIESAERKTELAKKDFWPDVTVSAGMVNVEGREDLPGIVMPPPDNGKNIFSLAVGINIPLWRDKYRSAVIEAAETTLAERSSYRNLRNEVEFAVRDQVVRLQTLSEQMDLYTKVLLTQAEESLRSAEAGYETGQLTVLALLDSERFLLKSRLGFERYRFDFLRAVAELERAVGARVPTS